MMVEPFRGPLQSEAAPTLSEEDWSCSLGPLGLAFPPAPVERLAEPCQFFSPS